jgi:hypothetical protein
MGVEGQFTHPLVVRAKLEIASACHAHGKVPSHGVVTEFKDQAAFRAAASRAANDFGYTRMWSIHPDQIRPILEVFAPECKRNTQGVTTPSRRPGRGVGAHQFRRQTGGQGELPLLLAGAGEGTWDREGAPRRSTRLVRPRVPKSNGEDVEKFVFAGILIASLSAAAVAQTALPHRPPSQPPPSRPSPPPAASPPRNPPGHRRAHAAEDAGSQRQAESPAELAIAKRVYVGDIPASWAPRSMIKAAQARGYFLVTHGINRFVMHPVESRTGAIRLEDPERGAVWPADRQQVDADEPEGRQAPGRRVHEPRAGEVRRRNEEGPADQHAGTRAGRRPPRQPPPAPSNPHRPQPPQIAPFLIPHERTEKSPHVASLRRTRCRARRARHPAAAAVRQADRRSDRADQERRRPRKKPSCWTC